MSNYKKLHKESIKKPDKFWGKIAEELQRQYPKWNTCYKSERSSKTRIRNKTTTRVTRMDDGLSSRVERLKGLGNSIIPQIAELLFNKIKEVI